MKTRKRTTRRKAPKAGRPMRKGGSRRMGGRMGEGRNFGKGQKRRAEAPKESVLAGEEIADDALGFS